MPALKPEQQLTGFLDEYDPAIVEQMRAAHAKLRALVRGAVEMVYDNYNGLVIGFGATERASEAVLSIVAFPRHITLCFLWGKDLPDPKGLLKGEGNQVRNIRLASADTLDDPGVRELIQQAIIHSAVEFDETKPNQLIIKSISPNRRPRRPR